MTTTSDPNVIYCLKCKAKTETTGLAQVTLNNGRPASTGLCAVCGKKKFPDGRVEVLKGPSQVTAALRNPGEPIHFRKISSW